MFPMGNAMKPMLPLGRYAKQCKTTAFLWSPCQTLQNQCLYLVAMPNAMKTKPQRTQDVSDDGDRVFMQESPREPQRTPENQREPKRTQENPREPKRTKENPREPKRTQDNPTRTQENPGEPKMSPTTGVGFDPREPKRAQENPTRTQENPREPKMSPTTGVGF